MSIPLRRTFPSRLNRSLSSLFVQSRPNLIRIQSRGESSDATPSTKSPPPPMPTTPSETKAKVFQWPEGKPHLPYVPTEPPTVPPLLNWKGRLTEFLFAKRSAEDRKWIRQEILRDAMRSRVQNLQEMRQNKAKYYEAANTLVDPELSNYMHNLSATALDGKRTELLDLIRGKPSLVTFASTAFSVRHVKTFLNPLLEKFGHSHPDMQLVQVCFEENILKWPIVYSSIPNLRKTVPVELHPKYLLHYGRLPVVHRKTLNILNNLLGYVFLVDANGKIRWTAHGEATEKEVETLLELINKLDDDSRPS